jgi:hypothetical protein
MPKPMQLPSPLPTGSIYVIESHGRTKCSMLIHRYVELPDGHCVDLAPGLVRSARRRRANLRSAVVHVEQVRVDKVGIHGR